MIIMHSRTVAKVVEVVCEAPGVKTLILECPVMAVKAKPGQFIMLWLPGQEEVPMSLSLIKPPRLIGVTVKAVGDTTRALHALSKGSLLGVRGPYGRGFTVAKLKALTIGGGVGVAPLAPLAEEIKAKGGLVTAIVAATTAEALIFKERFSKVVDELIVATDDGSEGIKGRAHEVLDSLLSGKSFDMIYACGPEPMLFEVVKIASRFKTSLEASLERYIKCGVGLCGSCAINGMRVCVDGPVFTLEELLKMTELGKFRREASGRKVSIE
ncbi:MAG: dihydroorotate dehydrogenase electron transfer subunit [Thermoprotei archaeon]|nr:MAG: dihydroorotate dehydrogenase electron transfer subunit [Thermoprotei archaeon]